MLPSLNEIQLVFFAAMKKGWSFGGESVEIVGMSGYKGIWYFNGPWKCLDAWTETPDSNQSAGTTTIWYQPNSRAASVPVFWMGYLGWYSKEGMKTVKPALCHNYSKEIFEGGRGPARFELPGTNLVYINKVLSNSIVFFRGEETVFDSSSNQAQGIHHYQGTSLAR